MKVVIDFAERAIPHFAVVLSVVDEHHSSIELKVLDDRKIDTVFPQIGGALAFVPRGTAQYP